MLKVNDRVVVIIGINKGCQARVYSIPNDGSDMVLIQYDNRYVDVKRKDWLKKI